MRSPYGLVEKGRIESEENHAGLWHQAGGNQDVPLGEGTAEAF